MENFLKVMFGVSLVLVLGACASGVTKTMSDAEFIKLSEQERSEHLKTVRSESITLDRKRTEYWENGKVVHFEQDGVYESARWDKQKGLIYIYPGFTNGVFDLNTHGVLALRADADGHIMYEPDGRGGQRPTTLLANVATESGLGRVFLQAGSQIVSSGVSGALAAEILDCGSNCGGDITLVNQGGVSQATSLAEGVGNASAGASAAVGCATGNCAAPPTN